MRTALCACTCPRFAPLFRALVVCRLYPLSSHLQLHLRRRRQHVVVLVVFVVVTVVASGAACVVVVVVASGAAFVLWRCRASLRTLSRCVQLATVVVVVADSVVVVVNFVGQRSAFRS